ncbi:hypothetical protein ALC57_11435 [Trachymyrmex cornetzi]|uniref:DNA-directed DNA polymerase n=1 Tax=Trachymyrmex cornetzi TaxID=471704 RepID=A0A151J2J0_9HYME|nr:hypothetical protein ALC57_11435 [Trachymyrmex cornetzi]
MEHKKFFCDREDDRWLEFNNHYNKERTPFVVYADLECVLQKTEPDKEDASYTYQHHKVCSMGYYVRCSYDNSSYHFRRDENCIAWFARQFNDLAHRVKDITSANVPMEALSKQQWETYRSATRCHICEKANNKYMRSYDSSKPSSYLMYYDVNNLYGWAMCQLLPYAEFQWVKDVANFDVSAIAPDSPTDYILEVDLKYPERLHDEHVDLPFCPTRDKPPGKREDKFLATGYDKALSPYDDKRYVVPNTTETLPWGHWRVPL